MARWVLLLIILIFLFNENSDHGDRTSSNSYSVLIVIRHSAWGITKILLLMLHSPLR